MHNVRTALAARAVLIGGATKLAEDRAAADRERALLTSKNLRDGWFSLRTHGRFEPNRGTIRNMRPKIGRNKIVKVGGVTSKMKNSVVAHLPIPHEVVQ